MRRTKLAVILVAVASLAWVAQAARADDSHKNDKGHHETSTHKMSDQQFISWAATRKAMERELGNMAAHKAHNPQIRQFGQRIAHDEQQANTELLNFARRLNVQLPRQMSQKDRQTISHFMHENGQKFDRDFMETMVKAHKHAVKVFEQEAKHAHDPQLRQFAEGALPQVKDHLKLAEQLTAQAKGSQQHQGQAEESEHSGSTHQKSNTKDQSKSSDHNKSK